MPNNRLKIVMALFVTNSFLGWLNCSANKTDLPDSGEVVNTDSRGVGRSLRI